MICCTDVFSRRQLTERSKYVGTWNLTSTLNIAEGFCLFRYYFCTPEILVTVVVAVIIFTLKKKKGKCSADGIVGIGTNLFTEVEKILSMYSAEWRRLVMPVDHADLIRRCARMDATLDAIFIYNTQCI